MSEIREPFSQQDTPLSQSEIPEGTVQEKTSFTINAMVTKQQKADIDLMCVKIHLTQTDLLNSILINFTEFVRSYGWRATKEYMQTDREDAVVQISARVSPEAYEVVNIVQGEYPSITIRMIVGRAINYYFRMCATSFSKKYDTNEINEIRNALSILGRYPEFSDVVQSGTKILKDIKYRDILSEIRSTEDMDELIEYLRSNREVSE
ncbi:MAG: hypothetical protein IJT54_05165 [Candidatus Methanomethylophilaceae archaeon]|nr:hypothetical protein [Candidatus Methanomethylophilaceae archaeon]